MFWPPLCPSLPNVTIRVKGLPGTLSPGFLRLSSSGRVAVTCTRCWLPANTTEPQCGNMKLLTHNLLSSRVRGVGARGFSLRLQATEVCINPMEFNPDFVARMIPKVEWAALVQAADTLNLAEVPKEPTEGYEHDETFFLRKMHHVLLEVDVLEGTLQCPESGHLFPISHGIPNMLLNDEETET
ncbi:multifunctional methyltransferase subunit TRM112 [Sigmodon hispidus]